jgi:hypothetical protein
MPEIVLALPASNADAPTMLLVKNDLPPQLSLIARSIVYSKSLALTGFPFEYTRPLRRRSVYVLPPEEMVGRSSASPGISSVPCWPFACR